MSRSALQPVGPTMLKRRTRRLASDAHHGLRRLLSVDLGRGGGNDCVLIHSAWRSGSTWLLEALAQGLDARPLFEPFRDVVPPEAESDGHGLIRIRPTAVASPVSATAIRKIVEGHVGGRWIERPTRLGIHRRRIVKAIRSHFFLGHLVRRYPQLPVIFLIRNPVDVVASILRLARRGGGLARNVAPTTWAPSVLRALEGLPAQASATDSEAGWVAHRWCVYTHVALAETAGIPSVRIVRYEDLCASADAWTGLEEHLSVFPFDVARATADLARPSQTARPDPGFARSRDILTPAEIARVREEIEAFGLDRFLTC